MTIQPVLFSAISKAAVKPGVQLKYHATGDVFIPSQTIGEAQKIKLERLVNGQCVEPDNQELYKVRGTRIHGNQTTADCNSEFWFKKKQDDQGQPIWTDSAYSEIPAAPPPQSPPAAPPVA